MSLAAAYAIQSRGRRRLAAVIDGILVWFSWFLAFFILILQGGFTLVTLSILILGMYVWPYFYYALQDSLFGGTIGKHVVGIVLVKQDLARASAGQAAGRALEIYLWHFTGYVGLLIVNAIMLRKGGQGVGDKLAGIYVVKKSLLSNPPVPSYALGPPMIMAGVPAPPPGGPLP